MHLDICRPPAPGLIMALLSVFCGNHKFGVLIIGITKVDASTADNT